MKDNKRYVSKLEQLNSRLPNTSKISIMRFSDIKDYLMNYPTLDNIQRLLLNIEGAKCFTDHVEIKFINGRVFKAFYDGHYEKYDINGILRSKGGYGTSKGIHNGRIKPKVDYIHIYLEKLILLACDIADDKVAISYKGLEANVLDGSGNIDTAERLMIKPNFSPYNLEWCFKSENVSHSHMIKTL